MNSSRGIGTLFSPFQIVGLVVLPLTVSLVACPSNLDKLFQSDVFPSLGRELDHCLWLFLDQGVEEVAEEKLSRTAKIPSPSSNFSTLFDSSVKRDKYSCRGSLFLYRICPDVALSQLPLSRAAEADAKFLLQSSKDRMVLGLSLRNHW